MNVEMMPVQLRGRFGVTRVQRTTKPHAFGGASGNVQGLGVPVQHQHVEQEYGSNRDKYTIQDAARPTGAV